MNYYDMQWLQLTTSLSVTLDMIAYYVQSPARLTASDTTCTTTCAQPPITRLLLKHHSAFFVYKHENQLDDMNELCLARIYESGRRRRTRRVVHARSCLESVLRNASLPRKAPSPHPAPPQPTPRLRTPTYVVPHIDMRRRPTTAPSTIS